MNRMSSRILAVLLCLVMIAGNTFVPSLSYADESYNVDKASDGNVIDVPSKSTEATPENIIEEDQPKKSQLNETAGVIDESSGDSSDLQKGEAQNSGPNTDDADTQGNAANAQTGDANSSGDKTSGKGNAANAQSDGADAQGGVPNKNASESNQQSGAQGEYSGQTQNEKQEGNLDMPSDDDNASKDDSVPSQEAKAESARDDSQSTKPDSSEEGDSDEGDSSEEGKLDEGKLDEVKSDEGKSDESTELIGDAELLPEDETVIITESINEPLLQFRSLSKATRNLTSGPLKAPPSPQTPVTADHITIEKITIRWVSPSSGETESALYDDLNLVPTNDIIPNQQWQLDVAFSGKDEIKAGDLEIVLPAYIWLDRDGKEPGIVTVAVPREGTPGNYDFAWKRVGDTIVITNKRNLSAASKYMVQGTFRMTSPDPNSDPEHFDSTYAHQMIDGDGGDVYKSNPLFGVVNVTTPNTGETISMTSNEIFATIDTHVEVANASKTSYDKYSKRYNVFYDHKKTNLPTDFLPSNPEDYLYIKWYVDGRATGNQPFTMIMEDTVQDTIYKVEGTTETSIPVDGLMLGVTNSAEGDVKSTDGKTIRATLFEGYTEDDKSAFVWTAYKQSDFEGPGDVSYKVYNSQEVTVTGIDDGKETKASASASVAIRLPIVWTIKKEWIYNEDKYDTPLDVIKSRQPEDLEVWLDNESTGKQKVFSAYLSDENNWQIQYEDDGVVADYEAYEHSYAVTRHMHGDDGISIDIVTGMGDKVFMDDGSWYQTYWGYDHKSTKYDEATHTWTFVNDYHEGTIGEEGGNDFEVEKKATNHRDQNQKASSDKDLNLLRNGKETTSINYDVHTGTHCLGYTSAPGAKSWETDKHGKRYVTLELHDYGEYFESRELRNDEFRIATVTMKRPEIYKWVPEEEGSQIGEWVETEPVPVNLYARGGDETEWTLYAVMNVDGSITVHNGATVSETTVSLPEGMNETLETIRTNGARAYLDYNVGVILFPSKDIQEKIEEIFESTDYAKAHSFNYVTGRLLDDDKNVLGELERYDRTYLHGRALRLAVDLDKKTTFTQNDKTGRQLGFENKITLNQQSNLNSVADFTEAFDAYDIPGSKSGTFYDLLPQGMKADPETVTIDHGTVKVADVIENYKGTGRQLLIVRADLDENIISRNYKTKDAKRNDDSYPNITDINSSDSLYGTQATITFTSWYSYDEAMNRGITNLRNTAAYEADEEVFGNNPEWCGEKDAPTGERHKESLTEVEAHLLNAMTNLDNSKDDPNFVYAGDTYRVTETDFDGLSSLRKYVQAAGDDENHWVDGLDNSVYVYEGGKYNYKIVLTSETDTVTSDIILLDSIEAYHPMKITAVGDSEYRLGQIVSKRELDYVNSSLVEAGKTPATGEEVWHWRGYFRSIDVSEIEKMGVDVKVYYSTVPDLDITHEAYNSGNTRTAVPEKLADTSVWSTEPPADPSKVTAVALDCRKAKDGSDFELHSQEALIAYMHMQAPTWEQQPEAYGESEYNNPLNNGWAYNNVYMDITQHNEASSDHQTHSYDHYDYTKVGIWALDIKVKKEWEDENDNDRVRPESVEVHLIREGVDTGRKLTLDETNNWSGVFDHVLMFDEDGNRIYYSLNENPVEDYVSRIEYDSQNMTLINTRETEKVEIPFIKIWTSEEPAGWEQNIPSFIKVKLYADGVYTGEMKTVRPNQNGSWSGVFTGMNKYKDGVEVNYTIEEEVPRDFISIIDQETKIIKNVYYPYGDLTVEKKVLNATDKALENEFTYSLTLKDGDGESVPMLFDYVITDKDGVEKSRGQIGNGGTFTLKDQDKIRIKDIPSGVKYEVKEAPKSGFTITKKTATSGTISSDRVREAIFENTYHARGEVTFNARKALKGRYPERYQFRFEVRDESGEIIRVASNNDYRTAVFGPIYYTEADDGKTYTYTIVETDRGKPGYTYDDTVYTAEVKPVDNGNGTMSCTVVYSKNGEPIEPYSVVFNNEYHAEGQLEFKAWKTLKGRSPRDGEFTFALKDKNDNIIATATNNADGTVIFDPIHFDETNAGRSYDYVVVEVCGEDPTVRYSNERYMYHVVVSDNGDGTLSFTQDVKTAGVELKRFNNRERDAQYNYLSAMGDDLFALPIMTFSDSEVTVIVSDEAHARNTSFLLDHLLDYADINNEVINEMIDYMATNPSSANWGTGGYVGGKFIYYQNNGKRLTVYYQNYDIDQGAYVEPFDVNDYTYKSENYVYYLTYNTSSDELVVPVFTNTLQDGKLTVEKHVQNPEEADPSQTFKFRVEFDGPGVDNLSGEISAAGGGAVAPLLTTVIPHIGIDYLVRNAEAECKNNEETTNDDETLWGVIQGAISWLKKELLPMEVYAEEGVIVDGRIGDTYWRITSEGELIIGETGKTQSLSRPARGWPWRSYQYADEVKSIRFEGTVVASGDLNHMFGFLRNVETIDLRGFDTRAVEGMSSMFASCESLTTIDVSTLDVSNCSGGERSYPSLYSMFSDCSSLTEIVGLDKWDTSNVTHMGFMFSGCSSLTKIDVSGFKTENVTGFDGMFNRCSSLESVDVSKFNTVNAEEMDAMFNHCESLENINVTNFITNKVTSMYSMFSYCYKLKELDVSKFNTENVTELGLNSTEDGMFSYCTSLKSLDLSNFNTQNVTNYNALFQGCSSLEYLDISGFDTDSATFFSNVFSGCTSLKKVELGSDMTKWFNSALPTPPSPKTTGKWMREDETVGPMSAADLMNDYPANAYDWAGTWVWEYKPIAVFDSSDGSLKFYNAETAKDFEPTDTQTVYPVDTTRAESSGSQFSPAYTPWVTDHREDILSVSVEEKGIAPVSTAGWFKDCVNLTSVEMSKLDTSKTRHMQNMFNRCTSLEALDLSGWTTPALESTYYMFSGNPGLKELNLSGFITDKVTNFDYTFPSTRYGNTSELSKVTLGEGWTKWESNGPLPTPPLDTTTGKWIREDGTYDGLTPEDLRVAYIGNPQSYAGTWIWEEKPQEYTVKFNGGEGATGSMADQTAEANKEFNIPDNKFIKYGYKVAGWNDKEDGSGASYTTSIPADTYSAGDEVTLYAQWEPIQGWTNLGNGVYEFELQDKTAMNIDEIPAGTTYRVYEETPDGWVLVNKSGDNGVIEPLETALAKFTNKYQPGTTSVQFNGVKHLDGKPASGYKFELYEEGEDEPIQTVTSTNGQIQFNPITYSGTADAGTHTYIIKEVVPTPADESIVYDAHEEKIIVEVTENGDGTMSKTVTYADDGDTTIKFENETKEEFKYGWLHFYKVADSGVTDANKDDVFTFQIYLTTENGIPYSDDVTYRFNGDESTDKIVKPSSGTITITGVKVGDSVVLRELPAGTKFVITETDLPRGWSLKEMIGGSGEIEANRGAVIEVTNQYKASGSLRLAAHKKLEGGTLASGEYTFQLLDKDDNVLDEKTNDVLDTNKTYIDDETNTPVDNPWYQTAAVKFDPITDFTEADIGKTFTYKIVEKAGTDGKIIYSEHEETVTVKVLDGGEGFLDFDVTYASGKEPLFTNKVITGNLSLEKVISHYTEAAKDTEFTFTIELKDAQGNTLESEYPYVKASQVEVPVMGTRINDEGEEEPYDTGETKTETVFTDGTVKSGDTLTMKGGEKISITKLPDGATYTITESDAPGWEMIESSNAEGTIVAGETAQAKFHNVYTTEGSVTFEATKTLKGRELLPDTYKFLVKDSEGNVVDYAFAKTDGTITFNGIDYTMEDDGKIFTYFIEEELGNEERISYDSSIKEVVVRVNDDGKGKLVCDITYDEGGMEFVNEVSYELEVSKKVAGEKADPDKKFTFTLEFDEKQTNDISYIKWEGDKQIGTGDVKIGDMPYEFTLSGKQRIVFTRVQDGATYTVTESEDPYYTAEEYEKSGAINSADAKEGFVNEINWFDVSLDKVNKEGSFIKGAKMAIYLVPGPNDEQVETLVEEWTTDGASHETKLLPGDYILKEEAVPAGDMYVLSAEIPFTVNVDGTIEYDGAKEGEAKVVMVDDYTKTDVPVKKVWDDQEDKDGIRPTEVVINLLADGKPVIGNDGEPIKVIINEANGWSHTFTGLDKYKNEEPIAYTVSEEAVTGYECSITGSAESGYTVTNKHVPEEPDKPDKPDEPDKPDVPDEPDQPVEPDKPDEPDKPVKPEQPEDNKTPEPKKGKTPAKTGDENDIAIWLIPLTGAMVGLATARFYRRRKRL